MGAPFWGNDFGGAVAAAPGFALLGWLLLGHELRWRAVWVLVGVLVAAGLVVGLLDVLRPSDQRTHVGKFFEKAGTDFGGATLVLRRKEAENLSTLGHSLLLFCLIALGVLVAYLWWVRPRSLRTLFAGAFRPHAPLRAALGIVALLGFALNDSGVTIPSMMAAVAEATIVILLARVVFAQPPPRARRSPRRAASCDRLPVTVVVAFLVGLVTVRFLRMVSGEILSSPALERSNYHGHTLADRGRDLHHPDRARDRLRRSVLGAIGVGSEAGLTEARLAVLSAVFGFGFLGLVDDLASVGEDRGFKGHLGALREGRVTTGLLKLLGGAAVAIVIVATPGFKSGRTLIVDAALHRAGGQPRQPARPRAGTHDQVRSRRVPAHRDRHRRRADRHRGPAPVMGAALGLLPDDLRERLMLGDTGANVIGAVLGLAVVLRLARRASG